MVVETIGGTRFAYPYVRQGLSGERAQRGCTSNKELVATHGAELLALAKAHKAAFLFEASVGGGTPLHGASCTSACAANRHPARCGAS